MLYVRGLSSGYGSSRVVHGVDLDVAEGEIVAVIGRNGMGKTTFLKAVLGLLPRWAGTVELWGRDVTREPAHRIVRTGVAYAPQEEAVFGARSLSRRTCAGACSRGPAGAARAATPGTRCWSGSRSSGRGWRSGPER